MNNEVDRLGELYTDNAVKVTTGGEVLEGALAIVESYRSSLVPVDSIQALHTYRAVLDSSITYEIGRFWTPEQEFAQLIIWRKRDGTLKRELEFVAPISVGSTLPLEKEIETSRQQWMTLCETHDAAHLVDALYTDNALYYNHKPMVIGKEAITAAYSYMNDPNYELVLEPFVVEVVNANLAFEIGQCSGSYPGNYVLIWQKDEAGAWRILFDSNI